MLYNTIRPPSLPSNNIFLQLFFHHSNRALNQQTCRFGKLVNWLACRLLPFVGEWQHVKLLVTSRTSDTERSEEAGGNEAPVGESKALLARVEWQVGVGTLGVMVRRRETSTGGMEASAGDQRGRGTGGGTGEHLHRPLVKLRLKPIDPFRAYFDRRGGEMRPLKLMDLEVRMRDEADCS